MTYRNQFKAISLLFLLLALCDCTRKRPHNSDRSQNNVTTIETSTSEDALANLFLVDAFETDYASYDISRGKLQLMEATPSSSPASGSTYASIRDNAAKMLFGIADKDDSSTLTLDEFLAFHVMDISLPTSSAARVRSWRESAFNAADNDRSSALSEAEALSLMDDANTYVTKLRALRQGDNAGYATIYWDRLLAKYDVDKDGKLSRSERKSISLKTGEEFNSVRDDLADFCATAANEQKAQCKSYELLRVICRGSKLPNLVQQMCKRVTPTASTSPSPSPTESGTSTSTAN